MRLKLLPWLMLGMMLAGASLLCAQERRVEQEQAIAEIKGLKGQVKRDGSAADKPVISVDLHGTRVTDAGLEHLQGLSKLQTLNLYNTKITDAGLAHLQSLTSLTTLYLNNTQITDAGLVHLKGLTRLQQLGLYRTQVSDEGLAHLKSLTGLQK